MKLPKYGDEIVIARDLYATPVCIVGISLDDRPCWDLFTDGRVILTPFFARLLAKQLLAFAKEVEKKTIGQA